MSDSSLSFNISALDRASKTFIDLAATVDKLGVKLDELGAREAKPKVEVSGTAEAQADLDALDAYLDVIGRKNETAKVSVDTKDATSSMNSFGGSFNLLAAGIVAAAPLAGAAVLASIGGAFAALGIYAESSNAQVKKSFADLEQTAKATVTEGFAPLAPVLVGLEQQGTTAVSHLESSFRQAANATAPLLQAVGSDLISATQKGVQDASGDLTSLGAVARAVGQDFLSAEQGIQGLVKNLNVGDAAQSLQLIGNVLKDDLPAIGNLVSAIAPLSNMLLAVLDPAIKDAANDLALLKPLFQAVSAVVTPLGPVLGALALPLLAAGAASKLLTGSWVDLGGAASKLISPFDGAGGAAKSLAGVFGVTTAAQNASSKASLEQAAATAAAQAATTKLAAEQAFLEFQNEGSAKSLVELDEALVAQVAASDALAGSMDDLAGAEEGATLAMGPIGIVIGIAGAALLAFGINAAAATTSTQSMSGELNKLEQSAGQGAAALAQLFGQDANAKQLSDTLAKYGVTVQTLTQAQNGNVAAQQQVVAALKQAQQAAQDKLDTDKKAYDALTTGNVVVGENGQTYTANAASVKQATDAVTADQAAVTSAGQAYTDAQNNVQNLTAAMAQQGITLSASQNLWNQMGSSIQSSSQSFQQATSGLKYLFDAENTSITTANQAAQAQTQLHQAVTTAQQSYQAAAQGVAQADYQVQQSAQGVASARNSLQKAIEGETLAENTLMKAEGSEVVAQNALIAARAAAAQQLIDLQRQVTDQADSVASAQVALFDAQQAVKSAGLQGQSLGNFGQITTANEANYKLLLQLSQAQHSYNDALAQQQQLSQQNSQAQQLGVNGASGVVSAQNAVASAQDGVTSAMQGVTDAQYSASQASLALKNAQYQQQQASLAVQTAAVAEQNARTALGLAIQNNTTDTSDNSVQAANNRSSIEGMYQANVALYGPTVQAAQATEQQGAAAGYSKTQVDGVISSLGGLNGTVSVFSVVGTPSLNLTALLQQASAEGINPYSLGLDPAAVDASRMPGGGPLGTGSSYATGGWVSGEGGPTDDMIPAWLSNGEYVVNAKSARANMAWLEQINAPGFASGGSVATNGKALLGLNFRLAGWDATLQGVSNWMKAFGKSAPDLPKPTGPIDMGAFTPVAGGGGTGGGNAVPAQSGSAAAAHAFALAHLADFGWGPDQMPDLIKLWNQESGWNANAVNKSSGAYGIPQSLGHGHPYNLGDYANQVLWGLNYIKGRYGSPDAAWAHEVSHNWYAKGGPVSAPGSMPMPGALQPPSGYTLTRSATVPGMAAGGSVGGSGDSNYNYTLNVHNAGNNNIDLRSQYRRMEIMANI